MKKMNKKIVSFILIMVTVLSAIIIPENRAAAASKYITVGDYIKLVVQTANITVATDDNNAYVDAAVQAGIVKEGEFTDYSKYLTRGDAAAIINRADKYVNPDDVLDEELYNFVYSQRISDLSQIVKDKRQDVAEAVAKGFLVGYSNGYYVKNRALKGTQKITAAGAKSIVTMLTDKDKRAKLSPDGLLIRTTNLPKNADKYEYILAYLPNSFYEKKYLFELTDGFDENKRTDTFDYPVQMRDRTFKNLHREWLFSQEMDKYLYDWEGKVEAYLNYIFNVDYRTVDDEWINGLANTFSEGLEAGASDLKKYYIPDMKKNKVIVTASNIVVEPSTISFGVFPGYTMRCYVKYKITAVDTKVDVADILYSSGWPNLKNLKSGVWRTGVFDIWLQTTDTSNGDGSDWKVNAQTYFLD